MSLYRNLVLFAYTYRLVKAAVSVISRTVWQSNRQLTVSDLGSRYRAHVLHKLCMYAFSFVLNIFFLISLEI